MFYDDEDDEYEITICSRCNGSGEGCADGTRCAVCRGKGEVMEKVERDSK